VGAHIAQNLYTPEDIENPLPQPRDRPYGAWLYLGSASAMASLDEETVARLYLRKALEDLEIATALPQGELDDHLGFRRLGVARVAETRHRLVKLRQTCRGIPIFGSLVTVELSARNYLRSIDGRLADPEGVDLVARVSPSDARDRVCSLAGLDSAELAEPPDLWVFYDEAGGRWRLVYLFEEVPARPGPTGALVRRTEPQAWEPVAVVAHANASRTARYLSEVHGRIGVDHRGTFYSQVIRCVQSPGDQEWHNALWTGRGAVYGQREADGRLVSYAEELDVVAHELFHGVIESQPRLMVVGETGALNESYADLFATLVINRGNPDPRTWQWEIGSDDQSIEGQRRDLSDPARFGQAAHMNDFRVLPIDAAMSLVPDDGLRQDRLAAVEGAFDQVGILP